MSAGGSSRETRHQREQRRRKQISGDIGHACTHCTAIAFPDDLTCYHCGAKRPSAGWHPLEDFHDNYLGKRVADRYVLSRHVGDGSFSSVYRADSMAIPRSFAIKIVHMDADPARREQTRTRVEREVQALSRMRNPHVVSFYDILTLKGGEMGFVMDFIEGIRLDELISKQVRIPVRRTIQIIRQLANGVFEAHRAGLVHRDIKPDNIIIEELPAGDDFVHVLDFGIVSARGAVKMTRGFIGTPLYASPEQAQGKEVDQRSDIYSMGAVLFHMLTGQPPFVHDNVLRILDDHVARPAPSLSETVGQRFPQELENLVSTLLRKRSAERPSELSDVISMLDGLSHSTLEFTSEVEETIAEASEPGGTHVGQAFSKTHDSEPEAQLKRDESARVHITRHLEGRLIPSVSSEWVAFVDDRKELNLIELATGVKTKRKLDFPGEVTALAVCESFSLAGLNSGRIFRIVKGQDPLLVYEDVRRSPICSLAVAGNGNVAIAATAGGMAYLWSGDDKRDWNRFAIVKGSEPVVTLAIDHRGTNFAMARANGPTSIFEFAKPRAPRREVISDAAQAIAFSNDGYLIAVLDDDGIRIEAADQPSVFLRADSPPNGVVDLCFTAQNQLMAIQQTGPSGVSVVDLQEQMKRA